MRSSADVHAILQADVDHTRDHYRAKAAEFRAAIHDVPADTPTSFLVRQAAQKHADAIQALCEAVRRYDAFLLRGEVPDDPVN